MSQATQTHNTVKQKYIVELRRDELDYIQAMLESRSGTSEKARKGALRAIVKATTSTARLKTLGTCSLGTNFVLCDPVNISISDNGTRVLLNGKLVPSVLKDKRKKTPEAEVVRVKGKVYIKNADHAF